MGYIDKIVVNGQEVDSARPVYMHPIILQNVTTEDSRKIHSGGLILSNSSDPINTYDKLKQAIRGFSSSEYTQLIATGGIVKSGSVIPISNISYQKSTEKLLAVAINETGVQEVIDITSLNVSVDDAVNQLH